MFTMKTPMIARGMPCWNVWTSQTDTLPNTREKVAYCGEKPVFEDSLSCMTYCACFSSAAVAIQCRGAAASSQCKLRATASRPCEYCSSEPLLLTSSAGLSSPQNGLNLCRAFSFIHALLTLVHGSGEHDVLIASVN